MTTHRSSGDFIRAFAARFDQRVSDVKLQTVKALVEIVKNNTPVDTDDLKAGWHDDGTGADIGIASVISNEVPYGPIVEWGTLRMEPRAMMQRTIQKAPTIARKVIEIEGLPRKDRGRDHHQRAVLDQEPDDALVSKAPCPASKSPGQTSTIKLPYSAASLPVNLGKRDSAVRRFLIVASLAVSAVLVLAVPANADYYRHGGPRIGVYVGVPGPYYYEPYYYRPYGYYQPRTVIVERPVYAAAPIYSAPPAGAVIREGRDAAGNYCREYQSNTTIDGRPVPTYGTACLRPDGQWQIIN